MAPKYEGMSREDFEDSQKASGIELVSYAEGLDPSGTILTGEGRAQLPPVPELPEEEKAFAAAHPNTYAAGSVFFDFLKVARRTLAPTPGELEESLYELNKHIPFTKFIDPGVREEFGELDQQHQTRALLVDTLDSILLGAPKAIPWFVKGVGKVVSPLAKGMAVGAKALKPAYKFAPIEDLLLKGVRPFVREEGVYKLLSKKGWKSDEIGAILESDNLYPFLRDKKGEVSKAFTEALDWSTGMPRLGAETREFLRTDLLRQVHFQKEWKSAFTKFAKAETGTMEKLPATLADDAFDAQVRLALGDEVVGKITLKNAPDVFMANFARDINKGSKVVKGVVRQGIYETIMFDSMQPVRVTLGAWDRLYGTYKNVYKKISPALERRNEYIAEKHLTLFQMYRDRGLGTYSRAATGALKFDPAFGSKELKQAYDAVLRMDHLTELGRRTPMLKEQMAAQVKIIGDALPEVPRKLVRTWNDLSDHLFAEHVLEKIPQLFEARGLTAAGERALGPLVEKVGVTLSKIFAKDGGYSYSDKANAIKRILDEIRVTLKHPLVASKGEHPWFVSTGNDLTKLLKGLDTELTQGKGGKFIGYLENYAARVGQSGQAAKQRWDTALLGRMHPFYEKGRKTVASLDLIEDFGSMMEVRVRAQANELFLYPKIEEAVKHAQGLPSTVREYVDHYISRILGRTSLADTKLSNFLQKTIGHIGGKTYWTEDKVSHLGRRLNDLAIMGGLGFKPFAVMRDLFQPLLTVPADLGGLKGFSHLLQGYRRAITDPAFRKYIRDIGAIQEYAPELYLKQRIFPFGRDARWDQVRDAALWMYGYSDRLNRYTAGGAALHKWEQSIAKVGMDKLLTEQGRKEFSHRVFKGRYPWVRDELDDLLRLGKIEEAKDAWIKDVIADTQFLYRPAESPIVSQKFGTLGKTGFLFQSWWMNYGALLEKWMRTGDAGAKANKMFTWMLSSGIAATMMEGVWGQGTALRTTFLGPFPTTFDKTLIPAAWTPIYEAVHAIGWGIPTRLWEGKPEKLEEHAAALIRSLAILVPGGLQMKQIAQAVKKEGVVKGLPASIIRYQRARAWKPMPVRAYRRIERMLR